MSSRIYLLGNCLSADQCLIITVLMRVCVWRFTMRCMLSIRWWMSMRCLSLRDFFLSLHRLFLIVCYLAILSTNEMISNDNHEMLWFILWCFSHIFIALERFFIVQTGAFHRSLLLLSSFFSFFSSFFFFLCLGVCSVRVHVPVCGNMPKTHFPTYRYICM